MAETFEFPKGLTIRTITGGAKALKNILLDLRKYSFNGYVKTHLVRGTEVSTGFIVVKNGIPIISVYRKGEDEEIGRGALTKIWRESYLSACSIEVHARITLDEIITHFTGEPEVEEQAAPVPEPEKKPAPPKPALDVIPAPAPQPAKPQPQPSAKPIQPPPAIKEKYPTPPPPKPAGKPTPPPPKPEERPTPPPPIPTKIEEPENLEVLAIKLKDWEDKGYDVSSVRKAIREEPETANQVFKKFQENIKKMDVLKSILFSMSTKGYEDRVETIKTKLSNPDYLIAVEAEIESLREAIEQKRHLDQEIVVPKKPEVFQPSTIDEETSLILNYTFDNFVVGPSNRFPWGAALSVAKNVTTKQPSVLYNPLFVWSGPGLGKTHILNAIGNYIITRNPDIKGRYISAERFITELEEATTSDQLTEFREKYRNLDFLLIDDVQFLAGKNKAQEELFHTFNALYNADKQIAMVCDRPPRDIPAIQDRLVSRFESGLVADIQMPEFETRMEILLKRSEEGSIRVDREILEFIANIVMDNIRELEGALNKVVAYSTLMKKKLTLDLAKEVLKDMMRDEVKVKEKKVSRTLTPGGSYLVEEDKPEKCFEIFIKAVRDGHDHIMITRFNPKRIRQKFGLGRARILWLTDKESETEETVPPVLESIISIIEDFLRRKKGIILIDGFEYLISMTTFDAVIRFLRSIIDEVSETECTFMLSISPKTMKEWEIKTLEKEMEILDVGAEG